MKSEKKDTQKNINSEASTMTYAQQFTRLEQIAQQLSRQDTMVDIDQLLPLVDEAISAYQFCQSRIDAVESLLNEKLTLMEKSS